VRGAPNAGFDMEGFLVDVARLENVSYGGPYQNPDDLADIYNCVDLVWSVDCIAPESNSQWLLTNALYEAGYFGKPVLGIAGNAVGQFAESRGVGWCIEEPVRDKIIEFIDSLSVEVYEAKRQHIENARDELFTETDEIDHLWSTVISLRQSGLRSAFSDARARPFVHSPDAPARKLLFVGLFPPPVDGQRLMTQSVYERICERVPEVVRYDVDHSFHWLNRQLAKLVAAASTSISLMRDRAKGYSVLYLAPHSGGLLLLSCLIALVARGCGFALAAHYHSYLNMSRRSRLMAAFIAICGPRALHIVLAPPMAHDLQRYYPAVKRVAVLSNCGFIDPHSSNERRVDGRRLRLGHLSNLSAEKGLGAVLDCVHELRRKGVGVELLLAGPPESQEADQMIKSAQTELGDSLRYLGRLEPDEVRRFYQDIDIFLFPTTYRHEAEPLVIIDAIASGVPVIATNRGCIDYLLQSSGGHVIALEDYVIKAAEHIALWAKAPDQLAEASRHSRERFFQLHTESQLRFEQLIDALILR
jgi:glycosyltransferase involved in cell wall biosynthesis